jgi:hypothetical protein
MGDTPIKYVNIKEFRETGYLQELNRSFLHPLGMALEIKVDDDGNETLGGIWDYREDDEGIHYGEAFPDSKKALEKAKQVRDIFHERALKRHKILGYVIQEVNGIDE